MAQVLQPFKELFSSHHYPELLVGLDVSDDAAVYKIDKKTALILTLDFFTPIVDNPYDYGSIAAANAMSDIYAMGGDVLLALNICAFPQDLPGEITREILKGGIDKVKEAGGVIAGGHSITDKEPKYGLSVLGKIHPDKILTKSKAKAGDIIILTKPIGTGIITTAAKADMAKKEHIEAAVKSMSRLNKNASNLIQKTDVNGCTDITGYALLGHSCEMAEKSNVRFRLHFEKIPVLNGAIKYSEECLFPAGSYNNKEYFKEYIDFAQHINEEQRTLLFTPETSGGLLFTVPEENLDKIKEYFPKENEPFWIIGEVITGQGICVD